LLPDSFEIVDISQSVSEQTACFPGDVPFSKVLTVTYEQSKVINLTAITMSPHVGTHADAPSHIAGDLQDNSENAGALPLVPYVGPVTVIDIAPMAAGAITEKAIKQQFEANPTERVLFKTQHKVIEDVFADDYPFIGVDAVEYLAKQGVKLVGLDTPSVDHINSKSLETHHALSKHGFYWLENLNLEKASAGRYFLVAAPIKLVTAEAAPARALLLKSR
jgi:arylformamidase